MDKESRVRSFSRLEKLIVDKGMTCYSLSKELNIAPAVFTDWKMGRSIPKTDKLLKIAEFFGVPITEFME